MEGTDDLSQGGVNRAIPARTYPTGSGHAAGSDTSRMREQENDQTGVTRMIQGTVLAHLARHPGGLTWKEIDYGTGIGHHGKTSSALTNLRRAGEVFWLHEQRHGCHLFVHKMWRDRYPDDAVKPDPTMTVTTKRDAAEQVCHLLQVYLTSRDTEEQWRVWDEIKAAHQTWRAL